MLTVEQYRKKQRHIIIFRSCGMSWEDRVANIMGRLKHGGFITEELRKKNEENYSR